MANIRKDAIAASSGRRLLGGIHAELAYQMEADRPVLVAVDLVGGGLCDAADRDGVRIAGGCHTGNQCWYC